RIQPGAGSKPRLRGPRSAGTEWRSWQPHENHQLRQREALLYAIERRVLAAEPPWSLRAAKIESYYYKEARSAGTRRLLASLLLSKERIMTRRVLYPVALLLAFGSVPAFGVSKEIVQLQTQVQSLQDQMAQMKQSFDERMGVMKNLIEQSTD